VSVVRESPRGSWLEVTLTEGKNREIRRMCTRLGYRVETLVRIRIGAVKLGDLRPGESRKLTAQEVTALRSHASR
jgi:23S rRNA pseudouridine2605 synthase